jgi:tetratricopeptide (TPR) repeat protein
MGIVHYNRGDYDLAMAGYEQAYRICEKLDDSLGMAKNANNMGEVYLRKSDYDAAMMWYQQSLQFCEALGEKLERSRVLNNLGNCYRVQGDTKAALTHYDQAFEISEEMGNTLGIAVSLGNIGHLHKVQSNEERAITFYDQAITIARELESTYLLREYLIGKAEALFSLQHYEDAQVLNAEGLRIAEEIGDKEYISKGNLLSAKIASALGDKDTSNCAPRPDPIP